MLIKPRIFRAYALGGGTAVALISMTIGSPLVIAIACGTAVGIAGFLFEYWSPYRQGSCATTAMAAGAALLIVLDMRYRFVGDDVYLFYFQYVAFIFVWWGLLMFLLPRRHPESVG